MNSRLLLLSRPAFCLGSLLLAHGAFAASLAWDPSGTPGGSGASPTGSGGTGTWNTSAARWSNSVSDVSWNNSNGDNAIFGGTGGTVTLGEAVTVNNLSITSSGYTLAGGGFALTVNGTITNSQTGTITASINGSSGLVKAGAGTLVLNAVNAYTGATAIQSGTLQARSTGALTAGTTVTIGSGSSNAALDVRASQTVAGIANAGTGTATITQTQTTGTTTLTINPTGAGPGAADSSFAGTITDGSATGSQPGKILALAKAGSNTLTLTGANNYTGATTVSGGTLKLGSSLANTSGVIVSGGTLSGNDVSANINLGAGSVTLSAGAISAGGAAAGSFTLAAGQNFTATGGTLNVDLVGSSSFDQIFGSGAGSFNLANTTLALSGLTSVAGTYQLFDGFGGTNSVTNLTITGLADGFTGSLDTSGLLTISGSAVPEPSSVALLAGSAVLGFVSLRRRRV